MKKVLQWILEIIEIVLGIIWGIIKFVIKWLWKWIVRLNGAILGMSVFITLLGILGRNMDSYMSTHTSDYQRQFPESGFWGELISFENFESAMASIVMFCMFWIIPIVVLTVNLGYTKKCPTCKKWYSLKGNGEELIKCEDIQILAEVKTKNKWGEVMGTQEQYVPGPEKPIIKTIYVENVGR